MARPGDDEEILQHPSFGLAQLNRSQGGCNLFASSIELSQNTVRLTGHANVQLIRGPSGDRYFPDGRSAIEVEFSAAQFAEFITTMNVGFGVPCTIRRREGKMVENPPKVEAEAKHLRKNFSKRMKQAANSLSEHAKKLQNYLIDAKIPMKHHHAIMQPITSLLQEVGTNSEYWLELFEESTEKIVTSAKAEVDAFVTSTIHRAGLEHIKIGIPKPTVPALEAPKETSAVKKAKQAKRINDARVYLEKTHALEGDEVDEALLNLEVPIDTGDPDMMSVSLQTWLLSSVDAPEEDWKMTVDMAMMTRNG